MAPWIGESLDFRSIFLSPPRVLWIFHFYPNRSVCPLPLNKGCTPPPPPRKSGIKQQETHLRADHAADVDLYRFCLLVLWLTSLTNTNRCKEETHTHPHPHTPRHYPHLISVLRYINPQHHLVSVLLNSNLRFDWLQNKLGSSSNTSTSSTSLPSSESSISYKK